MKNKKIAFIGIIVLAIGTMLFSCNKEAEVVINENAENNIEPKATPDPTSSIPFYPHFKRGYHSTAHVHCDSPTGDICGYNIDDILTGDETCYLMLKENEPFGFYLPKSLLLRHNVHELIDSAYRGAMTFYSDFEVVSDRIKSLTGIDVIPAGRYYTTMSTYQGDSVVYVHLDVIL